MRTGAGQLLPGGRYRWLSSLPPDLDRAAVPTRPSLAVGHTLSSAHSAGHSTDPPQNSRQEHRCDSVA